MSTIDSVIVDKEHCLNIIEILKKAKLPPDKEEATKIELSNDVLKNFYFVIVAICHQTTTIDDRNLEGKINGKTFKGWDYLREKWLIATKNNPSIVFPQYLASISCNNVIDILKDDSGRVCLCDIEGRVELLNDIGQKMLAKSFNTIQDIYDKSKGYLITESGEGILEQLSYFKAYSDPVKKKSLYFLALMRNHSLWEYKDEINLGPPVDYHEIRGHLRLGSIKVKDERLQEKLIKNERITMREDIEIRKAVYDAIMHISKETGYSPSTLHYFFWNFFRNCCSRNDPHCKECIHNCMLPERYRDVKEVLGVKNCIFIGRCYSEHLDMKIIEPKTDTQYY